MDRSSDFKNRLMSRTINLANPLWYVQMLVICLLAFFILYPMAILLKESFYSAKEGFTLKWYLQAYTDMRNLRAIRDTLIYAFSAGVCATVLGTFIAWVTVRTNTPLKRTIGVAAVVPFIMPPFIGGLAWSLLASPRAGLINQFVLWLVGVEQWINIYSLGGIIFVLGLYTAPFVILIVEGALKSMDTSLEEASMMARGNIVKTTLKITLPLVYPAILSGGLLAFVLSLENFGVPAVLGIPGKVSVLTTKIYAAHASYPQNFHLGSALSVTLLFITIIGVYFQKKFLEKKSFTTIMGKSTRVQLIDLGRWRYVTLAVCLLYLLVSVVLPIAVLLLSSLRTVWTHYFEWSQLTLENYNFILFSYDLTQRGIRNSLVLSTVGATFTILFCAVIAFLSIKAKLPGKKLLEYLAMISIGIPGIVLAFGMVRAWISPPLVLYGTIWIMLLGYFTRYLPYGYRSVSSTLIQIHPELEESSLMSRANWFQTFRRITIPLLKPGIVAGWILLFISFFRELSASILLYTPGNEVISVAMYDMWESGEFRYLSAVSIIVIIIAVAALYLVRKFSGVDTDIKA